MVPRNVKAGVPMWIILIIVGLVIYLGWFPTGAVRRELLFSHPKEAIFSKIKHTIGGRYQVKPKPDCLDNLCEYYLCTKDPYFKFVKCSAYPNPEDLTK